MATSFWRVEIIYLIILRERFSPWFGYKLSSAYIKYVHLVGIYSLVHLSRFQSKPWLILCRTLESQNMQYIQIFFTMKNISCRWKEKNGGGGVGARRRIDYLHDHGLLVGTTTSKSRITGTHDYFSSRDSTLLREKLNLPPYCFYCSFFLLFQRLFTEKLGKPTAQNEKNPLSVGVYRETSLLTH